MAGDLRAAGYGEPGGYYGADAAEPLVRYVGRDPREYARHPGQVTYAEPQYPELDGYLGEVDSSNWGADWDGSIYRDPGDDVEDEAVPEPAEADGEPWRETVLRGPLAGAVSGLLAVGVLAGVSALFAQFIGSQASPVRALAGMMPAWAPTYLTWLVLLAVAVVVAVCIGNLSRRSAVPGVAGLAGLSLLAGFVVIIRPRAHGIDVLPTVIGGLAAIGDFLWLARATVKTPSRAPQIWRWKIH